MNCLIQRGRLSLSQREKQGDIMSESFDLSQVPDDVKEMNRILGDFGDYHTLILNANFPGKACKVVESLITHVMDVYKQTQAQYMAHPWVVAKQAEQSAQEKELQE